MAKPKRLAYCIGLNYTGTENELRGCEADANNLAAVMLRRGFEVDVLDESSAAEFFNALDFYAGIQTPADTLVITYSGHGTQVYDPTDPRELDWYDEAICLWTRGGGIEAVKDDDIQKALGRIKGSVFFISDSCYAGGLDKDVKVPPTDDARQKFIPFDPDTMLIYRPKGTAKAATRLQRVYQLFACDEQEVSWDTGKGGVFTNALLKHYNAGTKGVGKLIEKCRADLVDWQTPVMPPPIRGSKARYLF